MTAHALLLNASGEPIRLVSARKALSLILRDVVEVIEPGTNGIKMMGNNVYVIPSVMRLKTYAKIPFKGTLKWSKAGVLKRDNHTCQYCFRPGREIDHVRPRALGGLNAWTNTVCACRKCNGKKGNKTLAQLGWQLLNKPYAPKATYWIAIGVEIDPAWEPYLPKAA